MLATGYTLFWPSDEAAMFGMNKTVIERKNMDMNKTCLLTDNYPQQNMKGDQTCL